MLRGVLFVATFLASTLALAADAEQLARARLDEAASKAEPLVAHVVVALADNKNQGIVPVPKGIGNGQKPETNLYWGAGYGVRHYFGKKAGWKELKVEGERPPHVLDRVMFQTTLIRAGKKVSAVVIADAYDGARIKDAIQDYLEFSAGRMRQRVIAGALSVSGGGAADLVAYVGHDGLMDFDVLPPAAPSVSAPRAAIVLACISRDYFGSHLQRAGAYPLLMTTGLMAPEAYTLDAALRSWFGGGSANEVREAAAKAYDAHQHCGLRGARRLFGAPAPKSGSAAAGR